jgi:hypothetical protein
MQQKSATLLRPGKLHTFEDEFDAVAVVVFLPDYGFFSSASRRSICHLDSPFKLLPYQAMSASLPIKSPGASGRWSDEAVSVFKVGDERKDPLKWVLLDLISLWKAAFKSDHSNIL